MKRGGLFLAIGLVTALFRLLMQGLNEAVVPPLPAPDEWLPSPFVQSGTLPVAFFLFGTAAYSLVAALFLPVRRALGERTPGRQYGLALALLWAVYLLEPLPHALKHGPGLIQLLAYPVMDGAALLLLGFLLDQWRVGRGEPQVAVAAPPCWTLLPFPAALLLVRLPLYGQGALYSGFDRWPGLTLLWGVAAGLVTGWLWRRWRGAWDWLTLPRQALGFGLGWLGVNLLLFNEFMPLVFQVPQSDLLLRTFADALAATVAVLVVGSVSRRSPEA